MIDLDILESEWKQMRGKVRQHWMALTEEDVERIDGHEDVLVELLQEKYGYSQLKAEEEVRRFIRETREGHLPD
jgi:uncharacterized protein YjbJ (UPF0337 family)